jgi:membrane protease YdiL (CAAX protease family)
LSSPQNPFEQLPRIEPPAPANVPLPPEQSVHVEDPPFTGWDLLVLVGLTIGAIAILGALVVIVAHWVLYPNIAIGDLAQSTGLAIATQFFTYVVVLFAMVKLVEMRAGRFWQPIRWNWPRGWAGFLAAGSVLYFVLIGFAQVLPIPKHLPIDRFFDSPRQAMLMSIFAVTMAPLMEELFFRGFLYPVMARRIGMVASILLTSVAFGFLHGAQLKYSWAVLVIFLVGIVLTTVRAITKSVAASFLVHVGYNGTLSVLLFVATGGFRHLERLTQ